MASLNKAKKEIAIKKAATVIDNILTCYDFGSKVIMRLEDDSKFYLNHAFYIKLSGYILVFTEHNGIFIKMQEEVVSIRQYKLRLIKSLY